MSRCYVGNLPPSPSNSALAEHFDAAGKVLDVQVKKTISNDWYAFIHFETDASAEDAVRRFDGTDFMGSRLRVELPFASRRAPPSRRPGGYGRPSDRMGPRVAVRVSGIPESGSWQDLKDHFREAGDCVFADTYGDGNGIVEYSSFEDARRAVKMFDGSSFRSHQGESGRLRLDIAPPGRSDSYSRDRGGRDHDSPYRRDGPSSRSHYRDEYREDYSSRRDDYGPVRGGGGDRYYGGDRGRSPPRRGGGRARSPPPRAGPYDDERYTTQDSRSTEALSGRSNGRADRQSPPRGGSKGTIEGNWPAGAAERDLREEY